MVPQILMIAYVPQGLLWMISKTPCASMYFFAWHYVTVSRTATIAGTALFFGQARQFGNRFTCAQQFPEVYSITGYTNKVHAGSEPGGASADKVHRRNVTLLSGPSGWPSEKC